MKGIIIKNLYSIYRKNEKLILMILLVNALFMTMFDSFSFLSIFTMFFTAALVQDQIYEDRKTTFIEYEKILPLTSFEIVGAAYISAISVIAIGAAASVVSVAFVNYMFDYGLKLLPFTLTTLLFAYIAFVLLCILFPFYYRFGTKNIRLISVALLVIPTAVNFFISRRNQTIPTDILPPYLIVILAVLSLCIIAFSVFLSHKLVSSTKNE